MPVRFITPLVLAVAVLAASPTAQEPLPALAQPLFLEVEPGRWATFPSSAPVTVREDGIAIRAQGAERAIELKVPERWRLVPEATVEAPIHLIRSTRSRRLEAARHLRLESPDGRAALRVRAIHPGELELAWTADDDSALAGAALHIRGLDQEATQALLRADSAGAHGWTRDAAGLYRPSMPASRATSAAVLVQKLVFGTFLGGGGTDGVWDMERAPNGDLIASGGSTSLDFPSTPGAFDDEGDASTDATLLGLSPDGTTLRFATFFGGSARDNAFQLAVDTDGTLLVAGISESSDLPTTPGAFDTSWNGFEKNPFLARFAPDGSALLQSTYVGGSDFGFNERLRNLVIDPLDGSILLSGNTCSDAWPTTPDALAPERIGECDGYVTRFSSDLSEVLASSFFGTPSMDFGAIANIASDGSMIVGGGSFTPPVGVPFTLLGEGAFPDATPEDAGYLIQLPRDLSVVDWATWVPGAFRPHPRPDGSIVLVGVTLTPTFPTTPGAYGEEFLVDPGDRQFAACAISGDGEQLLWSTLIPSNPLLFPASSTAVDDQGRVYLASAMSTANYPFTPDAFDTTITGLSEPHISVLSADGSELLYASLIGKGAFSNEIDIFLTPDGCNGAYVTGRTSARDWPVTEGALDETYNGSTDAWIVRMIVDNPWTHLGGALPGVKGRPELGASGPLCAGEPTSLDIIKGPDLGTAFLVLGLSELGAPFKGGTLIPAPDFLKPLALDANGARTLAFPWPAGTPSGLQLWLQAWMPDAAAPLGFSATNGVRATVP